MASRKWVCDTCYESCDNMPWDCPCCNNETCENCFRSFGHCEACAEGKTDDELRFRANEAGFEFDVD